MSDNSPTTIEAIHKAQAALQRGDKLAVRHWAEVAATLSPEREEPWLLLAAVAAPRASIAYLEQALKVNPQSERAKKGLDWADKRLQAEQPQHSAPDEVVPTQPTRVTAPVEKTQPTPAISTVEATQPVQVLPPTPPPSVTPDSPGRRVLRHTGQLSLAFLLMACLFVAAVLLVNATPAQAFINSVSGSQAGNASWAPAIVEKSVNAPVLAPSLTPFLEAEALPTGEPTLVGPAVTETLIPTELSPTAVVVVASPTTEATNAPESSPTPLPTDTPEPRPVDPVPVANDPGNGTSGGKWILVDISQQHLYAYQGDTLIYSFVASTGMNGGTRVGSFQVLDKIPNAYGSTWNIWMPNWMGIYWSGSLENGIHALPILSNGQRLWAGYLGTPISYGCVVLGVEESLLLYNWAEIGTPVEIQY